MNGLMMAPYRAEHVANPDHNLLIATLQTKMLIPTAMKYANI
jgi:hypothetical protein